jgi:hypothetical protein
LLSSTISWRSTRTQVHDDPQQSNFFNRFIWDYGT